MPHPRCAVRRRLRAVVAEPLERDEDVAEALAFVVSLARVRQHAHARQRAARLTALLGVPVLLLVGWVQRLQPVPPR